MKTLTSLALAAALALAAGCSSSNTQAQPDAALTSTDGGTDGGGNADGGLVGDGGGNADGAAGDGGVAMPDGAVTSIGLVDFVTGLVNNGTNATAKPTTIDDKTIVDTNDPAAFNKLLGL